jgi:hypothetical protein
MLTGRNRRATTSGCNQFELIAGPTPSALISAIQQSGHLGIAATRMAERAEKPMFLDRFLMTVWLGNLLSTEAPSVFASRGDERG